MPEWLWYLLPVPGLLGAFWLGYVFRKVTHPEAAPGA